MVVIKHTRIRGKRGRPPKNEARVRWNTPIPESIAAPWELLLHDASRGGPAYAARQFFVAELLRLTMNAWKEGKTEIDIAHLIQRMNQIFNGEVGAEEIQPPENSPTQED